MSGKRFRARRRHLRTRVCAITAVVVALGGLLLYISTGKMLYPQVAAGIGLSGIIIGYWQDRRERMTYSVEADRILLSKNQVSERIDLDIVQDASLVDRHAALELLLDRKRWMEQQGMIPSEREYFNRQFTRWCTVDIGLGLFGNGRSALEGRPDGKSDLVLLRLTDGRSMVLSPLHSHELVSAVNKDKGRDLDRQRRA